jgi:two-component system sensor histidine kinase UhpB
MDLRKRLVSYLGLLLSGLLVISVLVNLISLRSDIDAEVRASQDLVNILVLASQVPTQLSAPEAARQLSEAINLAKFRHLNVRLDGVAQGSVPEQGGMPSLFGDVPRVSAQQKVKIGGTTLLISPNPESEIEERFGDIVHLCITLLLFSGATLLVAWWSAHRALSPVRDLEDGLQRLSHGEPTANLPAFELREFRLVANAINQLAMTLGEARAAQKSLARQLIRVQEDERRVLARELHDEMGQTLTSIGITAAFIDRNSNKLVGDDLGKCANDLRRDIEAIQQNLRSMLGRLRPHGLSTEGLAEAIRDLVASWQQRQIGIDFELSMPNGLPGVDEESALTVYRVVQEAITNVVRHSGARHCRILLRTDEAKISILIEDDGEGLAGGAAVWRGGLLGMAERVEMINGSLTVTSNNSRGLRIEVQIPVHINHL